MKKLSSLILFTVCVCWGNLLQAQETEFNQLLQEKNTHEERQGKKTEEAVASLLQKGEGKKETQDQNLGQASIRIETFYVKEVALGGYHFHVADYPDGTRIVTALDGASRGLQGIAFRGILQTESRNVQWQRNSFTHFYPGGRVVSYPNRQITEIY